MTRLRRMKMTAAALAVVVALPVSLPVVHAEPSPPFIPADADWLTTVNYFRAMSGLGPVTADGNTSAGAAKHSCYMLLNDITHYEEVGKPGYTVDGAAAGRNGNVAVSSAINTRARSHIELWMSGPFHAVGVLRRDLKSVGYGSCDRADTARWRSGATLDVLTGLAPKTAQWAPVTFPGNGATTNLNQFVAETPNPLDFCGWTGTPAGLPVFAMMPEAVTGSVTTSMTGPAGTVPTCTLSQLNTTGSAQSILRYDNVVVAVPRNPLQPGTYTVTASTAARSVTWSFTVDPAAATVVQTPAPVALATANSAGFQPVEPTRVVDTRDNLGATSLAARVSKRIQITGHGGIPQGTSAVSGNFTVVDPAGDGYLTLWNCSNDQPVVSTVNFGAGQVTPNAATVPLDPTGGLCAYSNVSQHLVIDVNGYYSDGGASRFTPLSPSRIADSRTNHGMDRVSTGETVVLQVAGTAGVPANATAVSLNVTSTDASSSGFVTVWACDDAQPLVSSLNQQPGRARPNLVVTPVAADGTVCLYTSSDVELVVDVTGYYSPSSTQRFVPSAPFRFVDTRDRYRVELNIGTGGATLGAGQVLTVQMAGVRGVPANAKAVSVNVTVTGAAGSGYITAWPCGDRPLASTANYAQGESVSNAAQLPLSANGQLCIFSQSATHVVLDMNGWWV
ncbi:MAG: CAP domain-containing protein [Ilumatobacteraceae bacterium]